MHQRSKMHQRWCTRGNAPEVMHQRRFTICFKFQFCFILGLQEKASQVVYDDRISVLHFPQPHVVPRKYYPVAPPPDGQQFPPFVLNIGLILIFFTLSVTKFFLISTRWFMSFVLFASILKQGFRLTDKTERVPKEVLKKWKQFIFYLFPQRG